MSQRWTQAECREFEITWLAERIGHDWPVGSAHCRCCGRKFGRNAGRICPKRKRPNRWHVHYRRALLHAQYPPDPPPTLDDEWILAQLATIAGDLRHVSVPIDERFWKYHRLARRHRALLRRWWALPTVRAPMETERGAGDGWYTRGRNKLIAQVRATGAPVIQQGGTEYRFYPHAVVVQGGKQVPLFGESEPVAQRLQKR